MTKIGSTNTSRQKKKPEKQVFVLPIFTTGTPGASRTQALAGGHRAAAVAVRVPSPVELAPRSPARPAVPAPVQVNPAEMGVLAAQQMFAYVQAQLALPQQQRALGAATICATVHPTDVNTLASINASRAAAPLFQRRAPALLQHGSPAALSRQNKLFQIHSNAPPSVLLRHIVTFLNSLLPAFVPTFPIYKHIYIYTTEKSNFMAT